MSVFLHFSIGQCVWTYAVLSILLPEEITPLKGAKRELFFLKKGAKREPESQKKGVPRHISINNFIIIIIIRRFQRYVCDIRTQF